MEEWLRKNPFMIFTSGLVAGIIAATLVPMPWWLPGALTAASAALYVLLLILGRRAPAAVATARRHPLWAMTACAALGMWATEATRPELPAEAPPLALATIETAQQRESCAVLRATIHSYTNLKGGGSMDAGAPEVILYSRSYFAPGAKVAFRHRLSVPDNTVSTPYQWLDEDEIWQYGVSRSPKHRLGTIRSRLADAVCAGPLHPETRNFIIALVLGDRGAMSGIDVETFRKAGIAHILALSGLHVGVVAMVLSLMLTPLSALGRQRLHRVLLIILLWGYTLLTGASVPALRATVMATLLIGARLAERHYSVFNSLLAAAFVILVLDADQLFEAGFQLSFTALLTLIAVDGLNPFGRSSHPLLFRLAALTIPATAVTATTLTVGAYHFGALPLGGFLPNLVVMTLLTPYLALALLYVPMAAADYHPAPMTYLLDKGWDGLSRLAETGASAGYFADITLPWGMALLIVALLLTTAILLPRAK